MVEYWEKKKGGSKKLQPNEDVCLWNKHEFKDSEEAEKFEKQMERAKKNVGL